VLPAVGSVVDGPGEDPLFVILSGAKRSRKIWVGEAEPRRPRRKIFRAGPNVQVDTLPPLHAGFVPARLGPR
jgi:hypothetical protein